MFNFTTNLTKALSFARQMALLTELNMPHLMIKAIILT